MKWAYFLLLSLLNCDNFFSFSFATKYSSRSIKNLCKFKRLFKINQYQIDYLSIFSIKLTENQDEFSSVQTGCSLNSSSQNFPHFIINKPCLQVEVAKRRTKIMSSFLEGKLQTGLKCSRKQKPLKGNARNEYFFHSNISIFFKINQCQYAEAAVHMCSQEKVF